MIWLALISILLLYCYTTIKRKYSYWAKKGIPYVKPKFVSGSIALIRSKSFAEETQEIYAAFPGTRYHGAYMFLDPILIVKDPDLIKQVTVKEFDHFVDHRTVVTSEVDPIWGGNLVNSQGEKWRDLRATLSPSFTSSKMRMMYTLMDECAQQFIQYLKQEKSAVIELEMKDVLSRYTNDVVATTAFGLKCDSLKDKNNKFYLMGKDISNVGFRMILRMFAFTISPTLSKALQIKVVPSYIADYFSKIITDTVKIREEQNIVRPDMIHLLMEARKGRQQHEEISIVHEGFASVTEAEVLKNRNKQQITMEDIISQAFVFFFAGFDTVSTLLSFTLYELALNPDIQSQLRQEIEAISGELTYEKLLTMKYLDMVVSEALRKWSPVVATDRKVTKAFTIQPELPGEKPLHLEEGLICWLTTFAIHRDPKFYPEPDKFDPERFNEENRHKIDPYTYLPFGVGPRNCIGSRFALLESKLLIVHVLRNFEVVPVKKSLIPMVLDPKKFTLNVKGGMWLGFKKI